jgi:hypothetical protein
MMEVEFEGFGRPLRNPVHLTKSGSVLIEVSSLG